MSIEDASRGGVIFAYGECHPTPTAFAALMQSTLPLQGRVKMSPDVINRPHCLSGLGKEEERTLKERAAPPPRLPRPINNRHRTHTQKSGTVAPHAILPSARAHAM